MAKIHRFPGIDTDNHPQFLSDAELISMLDLRANNLVEMQSELEQFMDDYGLEQRLFVLLRDEYSRRDLPWPLKPH